MKVPYRCLYNHELLILATSLTPYAPSYREPVTDAQTIGLVREVCGTGVDAFLICPQAWQTNLWISEIDRRWQDDAPGEREPLPEADTKYFEKAYYRIRRYMRANPNLVELTVKTAREGGMAPFFSYRMNECHFTNNPDSPTHSRFWKEHPGFMLNPRGSNLNWLFPEVREYHRALVFELLDTFDVDGFECDFMRCPRYFPPDRLAEGAEIMTGFVRSLREKLDEVGKRRGKRLALGVRVPATLADAGKAGLDVARWDELGLVDMVNACFNSQEGDVDGYRAVLRNSSLYGELNYTTQEGATPEGYALNIRRRPPAEHYRSTALSLLEHGADGVSLFNFGYFREHSFHEPRRKHYAGIEPPFEIVPELSSPAALRAGSQLAVVAPTPFGSLPVKVEGRGGEARLRVHLGHCFDAPFVAGVLRVEASAPISNVPIRASVNGAGLAPFVFSGELFPSRAIEALPAPEKLAHFVLDPKLLHPGHNDVVLTNDRVTSGGGHSRGDIEFVRLEIALYRTAADALRLVSPFSPAAR